MPSRFSCIQFFCDPMDCSPPVSSVHRNLQARILERVAMPSSRRSSWPRDQTQVSCGSCISGRFFTTSATWEAPTCESLINVPAKITTIGKQKVSLPRAGGLHHWPHRPPPSALSSSQAQKVVPVLLRRYKLLLSSDWTFPLSFPQLLFRRQREGDWVFRSVPKCASRKANTDNGVVCDRQMAHQLSYSPHEQFALADSGRRCFPLLHCYLGGEESTRVWESCKVVANPAFRTWNLPQLLSLSILVWKMGQ